MGPPTIGRRAGCKNGCHTRSQDFKYTGFGYAVDAAKQLAPESDPCEIQKLRNLLVKQSAAIPPTMTYTQAINAMGWDVSRPSMNRLVRALNGLGGWQRSAGEPVLSALVVQGLDDTNDEREIGLPGRGFYWLVNLDAEETTATKLKAHKAEITRISKFNWN